MAIGFTPKYIETQYLDDISREQYLVIAIETVKVLGWTVKKTSLSGLIANTSKGIFSKNSEIRIQTEGDEVTLKSTSTGNELADWGRNKKNLAYFNKRFYEVRSTYSLKQLDEKYNELKESIPPGDDDLLQQPELTSGEKAKRFFSLFVPSEGYIVTPILMDVNILVFLLMIISGVGFFLPDTQSMVNWGANFRPLTLSGEWWRLITNCFLHIGFIHLIFNMYALVYIGLLLEKHLGTSRYIAAYLLTGVAASVNSIWWHDLTVSAGASGAIFGLYGVFLALLTTSFIEKTTRKPLLISIGVFVAYNLIYGLKAGIDNAAHFGGLISGIIIGYAFIPSLKRPENKDFKVITISLLSILIVCSSIVVAKNIPNDLGIYEAKMNQFVVTEKKALGVINNIYDKSKYRLLYELKYQGINYWQDNLKLLDEADELKLNDKLYLRNQKLRHYCELRIKCYNLMYKSIDERTHDYDTQIQDYNKQIQDIISEFAADQSSQ
ncbi:rhomboid family intramembrane serine protease [Mucilaginibacter segetis]|uniref:Rhomboid family intramembrane serine protease n=1 Tax=Mucilaginibacter segetis TaxID=2793071 RepID=A0A934PU03_9SPHI|nr:rhomboid family intramembrane serine protease [Mucilaginibacter segetis]MBK0379380.1 rhomboid family intramembrane serine protease [Mucilaginibacter segetis]